MLAIGLILNVIGIGFLCWLIFELAVYALPYFVGLNVSMVALHSGAGIVGTLLAGIAAAALASTVGKFAVAVTRPLMCRVLVGAIFVIPAALAGHHVILGISEISALSPLWREVFACVGATFVGATAWTRLIVLAEPRLSGQGGSE